MIEPDDLAPPSDPENARTNPTTRRSRPVPRDARRNPTTRRPRPVPGDARTNPRARHRLFAEQLDHIRAGIDLREMLEDRVGETIDQPGKDVGLTQPNARAVEKSGAEPPSRM